MTKVFIDGSAGTTGLRIYERLADRKDLELLILTGEDRKNHDARPYANKGIGTIKNRKINQSKVNEIHHISKENAVNHITNATTNDHYKTNVQQFFLLLLPEQIAAPLFCK